MKFTVMLASLACLGAAGCADITGNPGNPDDMAYAGAPGSVYPSAANPPQALGTVSYDPHVAPMEPILVPSAGSSPMRPVIPPQRY